MSDPVSNFEIEDVLSSIRRLVSEENRSELRKDRKARPSASSDRLVLTPALRVADPEKPQAPQADATPSQDVQAGGEHPGGEAPWRDPDATLFQAAHSNFPEDWVEDDLAEYVLTDEDLSINFAATRDAAEDDAMPLHGEAAPQSESHDDDPDQFDFSDADEEGQGEDTGNVDTPDIAEHDFSADTADDADDMPEDVVYEDIDAAAGTAGEDDGESGDDAEDDDFAADHDDEDVGDDAENTQYADDESADDIGQDSDFDGEDADADDAEEADAYDQDVIAADDADTPEHAHLTDDAEDPTTEEAPDGDDVWSGTGERPRIPRSTAERAATLSAKIEVLEATIAQTVDQWEPDGEVGDDYAGTPVQTLEWQDHTEEDEDTGQPDTFPPSPPPEFQHFVPDPAPDAAPEPRDVQEADDDLFPDDTVLDEESLRELVADIVREELQGALGERITRNVRKLVRREIHRALTAQELE